MVVLALEGPSTLPRIGFVAGKKVGNAVSRNRAKRRLREAAARADLRPGSDYILIAEPDCEQTSNDELVETISERESR